MNPNIPDGPAPRTGVAVNGHDPQSLSVQKWLLYVHHDLRNGWTGPLPIGKEHKGRYKDPWVASRHGFNGTDATPDQFEHLAEYALKRITNGEAGVLALGQRLPAGVLGIDVDAYDGKNGAETLRDWETRFGPLPATYIITARRDGVSGIRLYRVPFDHYPKEIPGSGVEFLDHHHRYIAVPPSWHHTGARYALYLPSGKRSKSGVLPPIDRIPWLPESYLDGLPVCSARAGGGDATDDEIAQFAATYSSGPQPEAVQWIIKSTIGSLHADGTYNPTRDALCWAAREAKGRRFGWDNAVDQIHCAAVAAYETRGGVLDETEFARLVAYAVGVVRDIDEKQLYDDWQSDAYKTTETDDDSERRIEKAVQRRLEEDEAKRRVAERRAQAKIDFNAERAISGLTFLTEEVGSEPIWGKGSKVLWSPGEGLMICGPQGVGKSTVAQQLVLARMKLRDNELLGYPVASDDRPILYLAMDRRNQIRRSLSRMVDLADNDVRERLSGQLVVWPGPPPLKANESPAAFCEWVRRRGRNPGLVVVDSLKDLLSGLISDEDGIGFNDAMQLVLHELDCDFLTLHHQRKATADNRKPNKLSDVYGNTWLTSGQGSVILLWGEAGSGAVEFNHLKQPQETVDSFTIRHAHTAGLSTSVDVEAEVLSFATATAGAWFTLKGIGRRVYKLREGEQLDTAKRSKLQRVLSRLTADSVLEHQAGSRGGKGGGGQEAQWRAKPSS